MLKTIKKILRMIDTFMQHIQLYLSVFLLSFFSVITIKYDIKFVLYVLIFTALINNSLNALRIRKLKKKVLEYENK